MLSILGACSAAWLALTGPLHSAVATQQDATKAKTAIEEYTNQRLWLDSFRCVFTYEVRVVDKNRTEVNYDEVEKRQQPLAAGAGLWLKDGSRELYQLTAKVEGSLVLEPDKAGKRRTWAPLQFVHQLDDGTCALSFDFGTSVGYVGTGPQRPNSVQSTPISMGVMGYGENQSPDIVFAQALANRQEIKYSELAGKQAGQLRLDILPKKVGEWTRSYWFDTTKKHALVACELSRVHLGSTEVLYRVEYLKFQPFGKSFFPVRARFVGTGLVPSNRDIYSCRVESLEKKKFIDGDFTLTVDKHINLFAGRATAVRPLRLVAPKTVGLNDLNAIHHEMKEHIKKQQSDPANSPAFHPTPTPSSLNTPSDFTSLWLLFIGFGLALAAYALRSKS